MNGSVRDRLSRWSRRKAEAAARSAEAETPQSTATPADAVAVVEQEVAPVDGAAEGPPAAAPELPDLATLTAESDYTVFLAPGVAEETRRQALRILWRSDPVLANLSGLNDYDGDYRAIGTVQQVVETVYRAGAGYLEQLAEGVDADAEIAEAGQPAAQDERETGAEAADATPREPSQGAEESAGKAR